MKEPTNTNKTVTGWLSEKDLPYSVRLSYGFSQLVHQSRSPYQEILIFDVPGLGRLLQLDGYLQSCEYDVEMYHEPLVHVPALLQGAPKKVLILGAGEGATAHEALRWKSVERLLMLDIDQMVVEACREHMVMFHHNSFSDPRVELRFCDAFDYLEQAEELWDLVIGDLTDPNEGGLSKKVFAPESFARIKRLLRPGGIVAMQVGGMLPSTSKYCALLLQNARQVFPHSQLYAHLVPTFLGLNGYMVCSSEPFANLSLTEEQVEAKLQEYVQGTLTCIDGQSFFDVFRLPLFVRQAIAQHDL